MTLGQGQNRNKIPLHNQMTCLKAFFEAYPTGLKKIILVIKHPVGNSPRNCWMLTTRLLIWCRRLQLQVFFKYSICQPVESPIRVAVNSRHTCGLDEIFTPAHIIKVTVICLQVHKTGCLLNNETHWISPFLSTLSDSSPPPPPTKSSSLQGVLKCKVRGSSVSSLPGRAVSLGRELCRREPRTAVRVIRGWEGGFRQLETTSTPQSAFCLMRMKKADVLLAGRARKWWKAASFTFTTQEP